MDDWARAWSIAVLARRFVLLADRVELCCENKAELIERLLALRIPLGVYDREIVLHASALDLLCVRRSANSASAATLHFSMCSGRCGRTA